MLFLVYEPYTIDDVVENVMSGEDGNELKFRTVKLSPNYVNTEDVEKWYKHESNSDVI